MPFEIKIGQDQALASCPTGNGILVRLLPGGPEPSLVSARAFPLLGFSAWPFCAMTQHRWQCRGKRSDRKKLIAAAIAGSARYETAA